MTGSAAASYGGPGWRIRSQTHLEDISAGALWRSCQVAGETGRLREVLLVQPGSWIRQEGEPDTALFLEWPDLDRAAAQANAIGTFYAAHAVQVHWMRPDLAPPNLVFLRDLVFMTPEGAVLARPAAPQRAGEPALVQQALAALRIPILAMPRGDALFEGADALWLDPKTVMIGVGGRTNRAGARFLARLLADFGIHTFCVQLPVGVQHLLGVVNFARPDLAIVRGDKVTMEIRERLVAHGVDTIACPVRPGRHDHFGMNFVALAPGRIVMPAGYPAIHSILASAGIETYEVEISEYLKAAGGLACLTGVLSRDPS